MNMPLVEIGQCCDIVNGSTPSRIKPEFWNGDIDWFTPKDLSKIESKYVNEAPEKITESGYRSCSTTIVPQGSLLFTSRAPIGHIAITTKEACTNQGFKTLIPRANVDVEFLYYVMKKFTPNLQYLGNGATFKELSKATISTFKIPLPPLPQQKKIAAILDAADAYRQKTKALIAKYEELTQSLFLDMFGDPFAVENHMGESVNSVTSRITYGFTKPMAHYEEGIPIVTAKNVLFDEINFVKTDKTNLESFNELTDKSKPCKGDILMVKDGVTLGRPALVETDEVFCISQAVTLIIPNKEKIRPEYLLRYFLSKPVQRKIKGMAKGNAMPHLQITELAKFPVPTIKLDSQDDFITLIRNIKAQKAQAQASLTKAENLFNSLLQKAFKGELV